MFGGFSDESRTTLAKLAIIVLISVGTAAASIGAMTASPYIVTPATLALISLLTACGGSQTIEHGPRTSPKREGSKPKSEPACIPNTGLWGVGLYSSQGGLDSRTKIYTDETGYYDKPLRGGAGGLMVMLTYESADEVTEYYAKRLRAQYSSWVKAPAAGGIQVSSRVGTGTHYEQGRSYFTTHRDSVVTLPNGISIFLRAAYANERSQSTLPEVIVDEIIANLCYVEPQEDDDLKRKLQGEWVLYNFEDGKKVYYDVEFSFDGNRISWRTSNSRFEGEFDTKGGRVNWSEGEHGIVSLGAKFDRGRLSLHSRVLQGPLKLERK